MTSTSQPAPPGPETKTYEVIESEPVPSGDYVSQVAVAGRSSAGIHLLLTERAAEVLANILFHQENAVAHQQIPAVDGFDPSMWSHVAIGLLSARALNLDAGTIGGGVTHATMIAGSSRQELR